MMGAIISQSMISYDISTQFLICHFAGNSDARPNRLNALASTLRRVFPPGTGTPVARTPEPPVQMTRPPPNPAPFTPLQESRKMSRKRHRAMTAPQAKVKTVTVSIIFLTKPNGELDIYPVNMNTVRGTAMIDITTSDSEQDVLTKLAEVARNIKGLEHTTVSTFLTVYSILLMANIRQDLLISSFLLFRVEFTR